MKNILTKITCFVCLMVVITSCSIEENLEPNSEETNIALLALQWDSKGLDIDTMKAMVMQYRSLNASEMRLFINARLHDEASKKVQLQLLETSLIAYNAPFNQLDYNQLLVVTDQISEDLYEDQKARCFGVFSYPRTAVLSLFDSPASVAANTTYIEKTQDITENRCDLREIEYSLSVDVMIPITPAGTDLALNYYENDIEFLVRDDATSTVSFVATKKNDLKPFFKPNKFHEHFNAASYGN